MRSIAGRTTVVVLIVTLLAAWSAAAVFNFQMQNAVESMVEAELGPWIQPLIRGLQENEWDYQDTALPDALLGQSSGLTVLSIRYTDSSGYSTLLYSIGGSTGQDKAQHLPAVPVAIAANNGQIEVEVVSLGLSVVADFRRKVGWALLSVAVIASLAACAVTIWSVIPLRRLIHLGSRLIGGTFDQHFEVKGAEEVEELSRVLEEVRLRFRQLVSGAITRAMIWEGDLSLFPLSQLLMMLRFTSQTGVLVVMDGPNLGRICVKNGRIRGALYNDFYGLRAFYALFLLRQGAFKFNPKMKSFEDELQTFSWYSVLLYGARRVNSLEFIEQYVPDVRFVAHRADVGRIEQQIEKDLTPAELELFHMIDGQLNVRQLARKLQWTEERVQRYLYRFAVIGLIETQFSSAAADPPPQNVVSLWSRAAWKKRNGGT